MKSCLLLTSILLAGCHIGRGMGMPPPSAFVIAPDSRMPSEIDPGLHVELPRDGGMSMPMKTGDQERF